MATSQVETVSTGADKAKLGVAARPRDRGAGGFYLLGKQGQIAQWGCIAGWTRGGRSWCSSLPNRARNSCFGPRLLREVKKVVWPAARRPSR